MNEMTLPSDTGFGIRALAVSGRARYLSVTEWRVNVTLKRHNQAKIIKKSEFFFLLLNKAKICEHVHRHNCGSILNLGLLWQRSKCTESLISQ